MVKLRGTWTSGTTFYKRLTATKNDYGRTLHLQFQNRLGSGMSLLVSGETIISARRRDDSTNLISGATITSNATAIGFFTYVIQSGDLINAGKYHVQASYRASGQEITVGGLYITVNEDYGPR